ncbi:EAL domain-containing protein [Aestuariivirga sp.]|uniref:EAL domain-containing protein n=1 Tax=Aestuariivirga sp. TaxID=2650926 RepID=UPI003593E5B5
MSRHMLPVMAGLSVFPLASIAIAAYLLTSAGPEMTAVAGAIMVLSACVFGIALVVMIKLSRQDDLLWSQQDAIRDLAGKADAAEIRLNDVEQQALAPAHRLDDIAADVKTLRDGVRSLMQAREKPVAANPAPARAEQAAALQQPVLAAQDATAGGAEHLELLLEPVIELSSGSTAHYRARLDLTDEQGNVVRHAELMQKADQGGMRPALDGHMVKLVVPVLRRLRVKNPGLRIIVPIGLATLGSREETARIAGSLERDSDVANGIVFEFEYRDLGALDMYGIENLARLGRLGATMALSNVQVAGLDLASLRQLGVRFLTVPPSAADAGFGPASAWREFVQYARAMQFQIIISDIVTPQQATAATKLARFGYGSFFAPPRKVRQGAGIASALRSASAA